MQPEAALQAQAWLDRAEQDLAAVAMALDGPRLLPGIAAYHAQQAMEKTLKAFLSALDQDIPRTHDLVPLVTRCENIDAEFAQFLDAAQTLTPFAVRFRYPPGPLEPTREEAQQALDAARRVDAFVRQRLRLA